MAVELNRSRRILLALLLAALLLGAAGYAYHRVLQNRRLARSERELAAPQLKVRLAAAQFIVGADPTRRDARLALAQAYLETGQFLRARQVLQALRFDATQAEERAVKFTMALSYVDEAQAQASDATAGNPGSSSGQIDNLLDEARPLVKDLSLDPQTAAQARLLEARALSVRALRLRAALARQAAQAANFPAEPGTGDDNPTVPALPIGTTDVGAQLKDAESRIEALCLKMIQDQPADDRPRGLLFQMWLRRGRPDKARQAAADLAAQTRLDPALAGAVADTLLNLESRYAVETTPADADLAGALLGKAAPGADPPLVYDLARGELALARGRPEEAEKIARKLQENPDYLGHPRVICLLGWSLLGQGYAAQAEQLMAGFNDRVPSAQGKLIQGLAMIAAGNKQGLELLRQSQEAAPDNLTIRLAICQALFDAGNYVEAAGDLADAARLAPRNARLLALAMRLAVEQLDRPAIDAALRDDLAAGPAAADWRDVAISLAMVLDDPSQVEPLLRQRLGADALDVPALVADEWRRAAPARRAEVAAALARSLLELTDDDPFCWPDAPAVPAQDRRNKAQALAILGQRDPEGRLDPLRGSHFVPWPQETAIDLAQVALDRFPGRPELLRLEARLQFRLGRRTQARSLIEAIPEPNRDDMDRAVAAMLDNDPAPAQRFIAARTQPAPDADDRYLELALAVDAGDWAKAGTIAAEVLADHPWEEPAVLMVVRAQVAAGLPEQAAALLNGLRQTFPVIARLADARLSLGMGDAPQSLAALRLLPSDQPPGALLRWQAADVMAMACLAENQSDQAYGQLQGLSFTAGQGGLRLRLAAIDTLIEAGQDDSASDALVTEAAGHLANARWTDRLLARARLVMPPPRYAAQLDAMLHFRPDDPILLYYKARMLAEQGDGAGARDILARAIKARPNAPRLMMLAASLAADRRDRAGAMRIYRAMLGLNPAAAAAARRELAQMGPVPTAEKGTAP